VGPSGFHSVFDSSSRRCLMRRSISLLVASSPNCVIRVVCGFSSFIFHFSRIFVAVSSIGSGCIVTISPRASAIVLITSGAWLASVLNFPVVIHWSSRFSLILTTSSSPSVVGHSVAKTQRSGLSGRFACLL